MCCIGVKSQETRIMEYDPAFLDLRLRQQLIDRGFVKLWTGENGGTAVYTYIYICMYL